MDTVFKLTLISFLFLLKLNTGYCTESSALNPIENINENLCNEQSIVEKRNKNVSLLTLNVVETTSEYADSFLNSESDIIESLNSILEKVNNVIEDSQEKRFSFELPKVEVRCYEVDNENNKTNKESKFDMICLEIEKIKKILGDFKNIEKRRGEIVGELFVCCKNLINNIQTIYFVVEKREENGLINTKSFDNVKESLKKLTRIILIDFKRIFKSLSKQKENASEMVSEINNMCVKKINNTPTILESHKIQEKVLMDLKNTCNDLYNNAEIIVERNWDEKCLVYQIRSCNIMLSKWLKDMKKEFTKN